MIFSVLYRIWSVATDFLSVILISRFLSFLSALPLFLSVCSLFWQKTGTEIRFFSTKSYFSSDFGENRHFFCIILIDRELWRVLVSFDCQTVFVLQNSHDAFLSETVSDPLIFGFLPCHLWFFTLSFQRFYSNKVPFYEPCGTKGDGKSRFCLGLRKEWLFCALYFVSKRGGCFVKNVGSFC